MKAEPTILPDVIRLTPRRFTDSRGYFMETFKLSRFQSAVGAKVEFVQENQSVTLKKNTIRGLHYQGPPHAQGKLVRCVSGRILDVAVDIRRGSHDFGKSAVVELSSETDHQLWIPAGFLHGFRSLDDNTIVSYQCTAEYVPECEGAVLWNDPDLAIAWGIDIPSAISERDLAGTRFEAFNSPFELEQTK